MSSLKTKTVLVDTNVWLSMYLSEDSLQEAERFISSAISARAKLCYAITSIKDVFYIVNSTFKKRAFDEQGSISDEQARAARKVAWGCIKNMQEIATAVGADQSDVWLATKWEKSNPDFEDGLIRAAAQRCNADFVVTWDKEMLAKSFVPTVTPADAIAELESSFDGMELPH